MAAGVLLLVAITSFVINTILFLFSHVYYMDGSNYILYERFWFLPWFKRTRAFSSFGRTFTIPGISRVKTDSKGRLMQYSQKEIKDVFDFTIIFSNNNAIVDFEFEMSYRIEDIGTFITGNGLDRSNDSLVFISELKNSMKKEFKGQKLLNLDTSCFQQWSDTVKKRFDFGKYGVKCLAVALKTADVKIPLVSDKRYISEIKKLLGI